MSEDRTPGEELDQIIMKPPIHWTWEDEGGLPSCEVVSKEDYEKLLAVAKKLSKGVQS